jgi:hypothetical protein
MVVLVFARVFAVLAEGVLLAETVGVAATATGAVSFSRLGITVVFVISGVDVSDELRFGDSAIC